MATEPAATLRYTNTAGPTLVGTMAVPILDQVPGTMAAGFQAQHGETAPLYTLDALAAFFALGEFSSLTITGGTVTASTPLITATQTWNNAGVTFVAETVNITDTASAAASLLDQRQVGGVTKWSVRKDGVLIAGTVPAANVSAGTFGAGTSTFPGQLNVTTLTAMGAGDTGGLRFATGRNPAARGNVLTGDSSADVLMTASAYGIIHVANGTTGAGALFQLANGTIQIVNQVGAEFTVSAPAAGETRVYISAGSVYLRAGSSRNTNSYGWALLTGAVA